MAFNVCTGANNCHFNIKLSRGSPTHTGSTKFAKVHAVKVPAVENLWYIRLIWWVGGAAVVLWPPQSIRNVLVGQSSQPRKNKEESENDRMTQGSYLCNAWFTKCLQSERFFLSLSPRRMREKIEETRLDKPLIVALGQYYKSGTGNTNPLIMNKEWIENNHSREDE